LAGATDVQIKRLQSVQNTASRSEQRARGGHGYITLVPCSGFRFRYVSESLSRPPSLSTEAHPCVAPA